MFALVGLSGSTKEGEAVGLAYLLAHHRLVLAGQLEHLVFNGLEVALAYLLAVGEQYVVEEAILDGGTETELDAGIELLQGLCQQVGAGVPKGMFALFVVELVELNAGILRDGTVQFRRLAVDAASHDVLSQSG